MDKGASLQIGFDRIASVYHTLEALAFGSLLQRCRLQFLNEACDGSRILLLGDGNGRFAQALLMKHRNLRVDVLDVSPKMLELTKRRILGVMDQNGHQCVFWNVDIRDEFRFKDSEYDAVYSHFFLDCFQNQELESMIPVIQMSLKENGRFLISEFNIPSEGWPRHRARLWISTMYRFFKGVARLNTDRMPDFQSVLKKHGLFLLEEVVSNHGMLICQKWIKSGSNPPSPPIT